MEKNTKRAYQAPETQVWDMAITGSLCVASEVQTAIDPLLYYGFNNNGQTNEEQW